MRRFFTVVFICVPFLLGFTTRKTFNQLAFKDKFYLRFFAKKFIERNHASHVIAFDEKAVCIGGCILQGKDRTFLDILYFKGWQTFKKNESLFPHSNFLFEAQVCEDEGPCGYYKLLSVYIINKNTLRKCLNHHAATFKEQLGSNFDADHFVTLLENGFSLDNLIHNDEILLGILLGYGEESPKAFKNFQLQLSENELPQWSDTYRRIALRPPKGCKIHPLEFMGNPHSIEVQNLVSHYEKELDTFWKMYQKEDPLHLFFRYICIKS